MNSTSAHFQSLDVGQCDRVHWSLITAAPITSLLFLSFLLPKPISLIQFISFSHTLSNFLSVLTSIFFPFHLFSEFFFSILYYHFYLPRFSLPLSVFFSAFSRSLSLIFIPSLHFIHCFLSLFLSSIYFCFFSLSLFLLPCLCFSFSLYLIPSLFFYFPSFLSLLFFPSFSLLNSLVSYSLFSSPDFTQAPLFLNFLSSKLYFYYIWRFLYINSLFLAIKIPLCISFYSPSSYTFWFSYLSTEFYAKGLPFLFLFLAISHHLSILLSRFFLHFPWNIRSLNFILFFSCSSFSFCLFLPLCDWPLPHSPSLLILLIPRLLVGRIKLTRWTRTNLKLSNPSWPPSDVAWQWLI